MASSDIILGSENVGKTIEEIPVSISYDIIRLFSEGLYRSPNKAVEELVSNSYDAKAQSVHILLPENLRAGEQADEALWVIDDGIGMDKEGFRRLWTVAKSNKDQNGAAKRPPIGQFGIGKLAAYVLAWKLTHISKTEGKLLLTTMDFRKVNERSQAVGEPVPVTLKEINEGEAKEILREVEGRDSRAWKVMFGDKNQSNWTAAALTDFKDLSNKLYLGRLRWVLGTGLPLHGDFKIYLNGDPVVSSKEKLESIKEFEIKENLAGIGEVKGKASVHQKILTTDKSERFGRSHGFFIRVRGRVINLEDELLGVIQPNHAAWSRFALEVDADGLREHLLSSREGVRDSEAVEEFRKCLMKYFNQCRSAYDEYCRRENTELDIISLLSEGPSVHVTEPIFRSVGSVVKVGTESFYVRAPKQIKDDDYDVWLMDQKEKIFQKPFETISFVDDKANAPAIRYVPESRRLEVNREHPFVNKLLGRNKRHGPTELFASSEALLEGQLEEWGMDPVAIDGFLRERDKSMRLIAGDTAPTAKDVLKLLDFANRDSVALEKTVGKVFQLLGFNYELRGGNKAGPDGVLCARLGRYFTSGVKDYKLVYDTKMSESSTVASDKIDFQSLELFRTDEKADFGFFVAAAYAAEDEEEGKLNQKIKSLQDCRVTLLKIEHLKRLVRMHVQYGVTFTELRSLFEEAQTVSEVNEWLCNYKAKLENYGEVPLQLLLRELEKKKEDLLETPNVSVVRELNSEMKRFPTERLIARLKSVEIILGTRWLEVDETRKDVYLHQGSDQILFELNRQIGGFDFGSE